MFFDEARFEAREMNGHLARHKKPIGPLHGIPGSLEDQFHVRVEETTMGYVGWIKYWAVPKLDLSCK
jgi:amidase